MWRSSPPVRLWTGNRNRRLLKRLTAKIGRRHDEAVLSGEDGKGSRDMFNDKLSRSK